MNRHGQMVTFTRLMRYRLSVDLDKTAAISPEVLSRALKGALGGGIVGAFGGPGTGLLGAGVGGVIGAISGDIAHQKGLKDFGAYLAARGGRELANEAPEMVEALPFPEGSGYLAKGLGRGLQGVGTAAGTAYYTNQLRQIGRANNLSRARQGLSEINPVIKSKGFGAGTKLFGETAEVPAKTWLGKAVGKSAVPLALGGYALGAGKGFVEAEQAGREAENQTMVSRALSGFNPIPRTRWTDWISPETSGGENIGASARHVGGLVGDIAGSATPGAAARAAGEGAVEQIMSPDYEWQDRAGSALIGGSTSAWNRVRGMLDRATSARLERLRKVYGRSYLRSPTQ